MRFLEGSSQSGRLIPGELQGHIGALVLQVGATLDARGGKSLALECAERLCGELVENGVEFILSLAVVKWHLDGALAQGAHLGCAHAVGRQHPGQGVQKDALDAQGVSHKAGVLSAGAAKGAQSIAGQVVAALRGDAPDGPGHVVDRHTDEAVGDLLEAKRRGAGLGKIGHDVLQTLLHGGGIQRLLATCAKDGREELRLQLADHHVAVGDG